MANKKLKVEVELETAKAKRQAKELEQSGGASAGGGESVAPALDKTSKAAESAAKSFQQADRATLRLATGFAGLAVGLATSYAANYVKDPNAQAALQYVGSAVSGASAGAMTGASLGPQGALIGAGVGLATGIGKTYMDREGAKDKAIDDFERSEKRYQNAKAADDLFKSLTDTRAGKGTINELPELKRIMGNFSETVDQFISQIREELQKTNPDYERVNMLQGEVAYGRGMMAKYESAIKNIETQPVNDRPDFSAPDALSRIGGAFAGQSVDPETRTQTATMKEQLEVLKRIEQKSGGKF